MRHSSFLSRAALAAAAAQLLVHATPAAAQQRNGAAPPTPARQDTASAPLRRSWTSDRAEVRVGDVITVIVDEFANAEAKKINDATDRRSRDMGVGGSADLPPTLDKRGEVSVRTRNNAESRQRGQATRGNEFAARMSVRVTAINEAGLLQVKGDRLVDVDKDKQTMTLTGFVRPQDVLPGNVVESWRIADAQITYSAKGPLGKPRGGIVGRILGALWP